MKTYILQFDNREILDIKHPPRSLWYFPFVQKINKFASNVLNYQYEFHNYQYNFDGHGAIEKIFFIDEFLNRKTAQNNEIIVFLDCDAWINHCFALDSLVQHIYSNDKILGAFSRDHYHAGSSFVNTGAFILKNNQKSRKLYKTIIKSLKADDSHYDKWAFDQYYIAKEVFKNKEDFLIFEPQIMNSPVGKIIQHDWNKDEWTYYRLKFLHDNLESIKSNAKLDYLSKLCKLPYPHEIDILEQGLKYGYRRRGRVSQAVIPFLKECVHE